MPPTRRRHALLSAVLLCAAAALAGTPSAGAVVGVDCTRFQSDVRQLVRPTTGTNLLTRSAAEASTAAQQYGFTEDRGVLASVAGQSASGLSPVWRMYRSGDFTWAASRTDIYRLRARGYVTQSIDFYASIRPHSCLSPVKRLARGPVTRMATTAEAARLVAEGWVERGTVFHAVTGRKPTPVPPGTDTKFSIAVIPDTQNETSSPYDTRFANRVSWLVDNRASLDLRYAVQIGDLSSWGHVDPAQFQKASTEIRPLEAVVPWSVAAGNHDVAAVCAGGSACPGANTSVTVRDASVFNRWFPPSRFPNLRGTYEPGRSENSWATFSAGGKEWLVLTLELWARPGVVTWANNVVAANPTKNVIINTHAYLNADGSISTSNGGYGATSPRYLFDNLVRRHPNITMVLSGHVGQAAVRTDTGLAGNKVVSFLQAFHSTTNPVRLVEIDTAARTVTSRVYAPQTGVTYTQYATSTTGMTFR